MKNFGQYRDYAVCTLGTNGERESKQQLANQGYLEQKLAVACV